MPGAYKKGNFVIKNAEGVVTLAGIAIATAIFNNSNNSASVTDTSPMETHMDSGGVPRAMTRNYIEFKMELDLTPGIGGTTGGTGFASSIALRTTVNLSKKAGASPTFAGIADTPQLKGNQIITSGFDVDEMNWPTEVKAIVEDCSIQQSQEGLTTMRISAVRRTDNLGAVIDFTADWIAT